MIAFGHFPRTRIVEPGTGAMVDKDGVNSIIGGIVVARVPDMAGVWAQEFWEWKYSFRWLTVAVAALIAAAVINFTSLPQAAAWAAVAAAVVALWHGVLHNRAKREIFSHAITLEASLMVSEPGTPEQMVASLATYPYCKRFTRDELMAALTAQRPKARSWCEAHRSKIAALTAFHSTA